MSRKYKICVYGICKNEEQFVERWVESMKEADEIVVLDTGSTDQTVEKLRENGVTVYEQVIKPWRFEEARNACLDKIPKDVDICVSTDLDEVLEAGWRDHLEKAWKKETTRAMYHFTWSFNEDGSPGVTFMYDRIHAREGYRWLYPIHECLHYYGNKQEQVVWCPEIRLNHFPDASKSRSSYLPLLELAVREYPDEPRNYHYLGREYMYYKCWSQCIDTLKKHIDLPTSNWKDERCASMRFIARACKELGDLVEAKKWLYKAIAEAPHIREPYVEMMKMLYVEENWPGIYHMLHEALKIKERGTYINEPFCWDETIYDYGSLACYYLNLKEEAEVYIKMALSINPKDERLKDNYKIIMEM